MGRLGFAFRVAMSMGCGRAASGRGRRGCIVAVAIRTGARCSGEVKIRAGGYPLSTKKGASAGFARTEL